MNWEAIGAVGEIIGAAGVIVTLAYLAFQLRNQTRETKLSATRDLARDYRDIMRDISGNEELYGLYLRSLEDYDGMPDADRMKINLAFYSRIFGVHEQQHLHLLEGRIDPVYLQSIRNRLAEAAKTPGPHQWWRRNRHLYSDNFRTYIDGVLKNTHVVEPEDKSGPSA
jgi:hypothetical protein